MQGVVGFVKEGTGHQSEDVAKLHHPEIFVFIGPLCCRAHKKKSIYFYYVKCGGPEVF